VEAIVLQKIQGPEQLKDLTPEELDILAKEIREEIINCVSKNGGHLASSLGVVELTIALHRVFNSPEDKLIWDVGHQTYAHKLLTGRYQNFSTLRQFRGLSGFPKRKESPHDIFETGHSSTSISAAVGLALARDLKKEEEKRIIAIIGDGALTGGMALEALNHAGNLGLNLIVVLNDNEMSIDHNTGALASYLSQIRTEPRYYQRKEELEKFLLRLPHGEHLVKLADRFKESMKYLLVPGMLFEELGFTYLGPVNGHNISELENFLRLASRTKGPVLVHVLTVKGKGYAPAEKEPTKYHGLSPLSPSSAQPKISYSEVFGRALCELARQDEKIVAVTAAMTQGTGLGNFAHEFPHRFFDVGIAEEHAVTMAAGLAAGGLKPVVAIYSTFLQRAFDQIIHDVALQELPVIFAIDRAGIVGEDGETHQGLFDLSYLRIIPNMVIMAPRDETELQRMLLTALKLGKPVAIRYPKGNASGLPSLKDLKPLTKLEGEVLKGGKDLSFLTVGPLAYEALAAASILGKYGIDAAVVDMRFVKPLDWQLLKEVAQDVKNLVIAEENTLLGGFGSAVLEFLAQEKIEVKVARVGTPDIFIEHGQARILKQKYGLDRDGLLKSACELISLQMPLRQGTAYE